MFEYLMTEILNSLFIVCFIYHSMLHQKKKTLIEKQEQIQIYKFMITYFCSLQFLKLLILLSNELICYDD